MNILVIERNADGKTRFAGQANVAALPRAGEYVARWSANQTTHNLARVLTVVHHCSLCLDGIPLLPGVIVEPLYDNVSLDEAFYGEVAQ